MRTSLFLLALSLVGAVGGGYLIGRWAVGLVVLAYSLLLAAFALFRDDRRAASLSVVGGAEEHQFAQRVLRDVSRRSA